MSTEARRFTPPYALLVAAWLAQAGYAAGLFGAREAGWGEWAAAGLVMAAAPLAPEGFIPFLIPIPVIALLLAIVLGGAS